MSMNTPMLAITCAQVTASEQISGYRFTRSGGFAYRIREITAPDPSCPFPGTAAGTALTLNGQQPLSAQTTRTFFIPVVAGKVKDPGLYKVEKVKTAIFFKELQQYTSMRQGEGGSSSGGGKGDSQHNKFCVPGMLLTGHDLGLSTNVTLTTLLGITVARLREIQVGGKHTQ
jgi:hypothetical protein